ncbi:MAG: ABC transporter ATP-binding protein [Blautia sp.]|nr:ABC transporter ATP-binding protein [Blautia sp.]
MKKLLPYFKNYKKETILAPLFKLLESLMDLLVPLIVAAVINKGILGHSTSQITRSFLLLILLAVLGLVFSFTAQWFAAKASVGIASRLRQDLFDHIQSLSYTELDTIGTDTLITRMTSDVNQVQNGINMSLRLLLRSPFIVFGSMVMAFTIDVKCALIFALAIPVLSIVVYGIMLITIPLYKKVQNALDSLLGLTRENLTGVRVIRAFRKEPEEIREFDRRNQALTGFNEFVGRISALMNPATFAIINIAAILLIRQGALRVSLGNIRQGDVVALYNYMAQIVVELVKLASLIITINKSIACQERISAILDIRPGMVYPEKHADRTADAVSRTAAGAPSRASQAPDNAFIRFDHVSFTYAGAGDEAVTDIDFSVKKGQTVGIIGGTGSGKSTLASLLPRFYDASKGSVWIEGKNVRDYPEGELIARIGVVPQKAVLFKGTIRDNLLWGNPEASDSELYEALDTAQAREVVEGKSKGLDSMIEQNGRNLSGGQRQRLTIARALVKKPEILILDDSASALDFATDLKLRQAVKGLPGDMTVFIISQRTSSIRSADQILVMDDGHLAAKGTHEELLQTCGLYQEIYYSQFPEERPVSGNSIRKEVLA